MQFVNLLVKNYEYQACSQPIFDIFCKILRHRKSMCPDLIDFLKSPQIVNIYKMNFKIHDCNSVIIANVLYVLSYIADKIEPEFISNIISLGRLKDIFYIFKMNGFEVIHEAIIQFVKIFLLKRKITIITTLAL